MDLFKWDKSYSVGLMSIDAQHSHLLDVINTLFDSMKKGVSEEVLDITLKELIGYVDTHFKTEENLFEKYKYPESKAHIIEHNDFRATVAKLMDDHVTGEKRISIETLHFLQKWVSNHIKNVDQQYSDFFSTLNLS